MKYGFPTSAKNISVAIHKVNNPLQLENFTDTVRRKVVFSVVHCTGDRVMGSGGTLSAGLGHRVLVIHSAWGRSGDGCHVVNGQEIGSEDQMVYGPGSGLWESIIWEESGPKWTPIE